MAAHSLGPPHLQGSPAVYPSLRQCLSGSIWVAGVACWLLACPAQERARSEHRSAQSARSLSPFLVVHLEDQGEDVIKDNELGEGESNATLDLSIPDELDTDTSIDPPADDDSERTIGSHFYMRHQGGGQIGDSFPYTTIGAFYPLAREDGILFGAGQVVVDNDGNAGGGVTLGRRLYSGTWNRIFGISASYDVHKTRLQTTAQQVVVNAESRGDAWDVFATGYLPVSNRMRSAGLAAPANLRFQGNDLVVDLMDVSQTLMAGADIQVARRLGDDNAWAYAGWYHYEGGGQRTDGFETGIYGYLTDQLAMTLNVTDDPLFKTNVGFNVTYFFGGTSGGSVSPPDVYARMGEPVRRRDQSVINESLLVQNSVPLTSGGVPINVTHVRSSAPGANSGTFEDPFTALPATQPTEIVYVHADSVFNNQAYQLSPNQRFLGEGNGVVHLINTDFGTFTLPVGGGGITRPALQNAAMNAISIVNVAGAEVSNLQINNPTNGGLFVENSTVNINRVVVDGGVNSVLTQASFGNTSTILLANNSFLNTTGAGVVGSASTAGSALNLTVDGNEIDALGNNVVDGLSVQLANPNATVLINARGNVGVGGGAPDGVFHLINNTGNPLGFQVLAADALNLSNINSGVGVNENPNAGAFLYNPGLVVPAP